MNGFTTKLLHTAFPRKDAVGALRFPLYDNAAFGFKTAEDIAASFRGELPMPAYTRSANPTVEYFETVVKQMAGATAVLALSSGMAAINTLLLSIVQTGDNIVTSRHLFGNSYALFTKTLKPLGIEFRFVDLNNKEEIEKNIDNKTKAIFFEIITNPHLEVVDVKKLSEITTKHKLLLISDSTLATPYLFDAKEHGVNVEVISATKYFSGGGTGIGGLIIDYGTYNWSENERLKVEYQKFGNLALNIKLRRDVFRNSGPCLSPHNAYMQTLGLETLPLRADRTCSNALELANYLETLPKIKKVYYPGLKSSPSHEIAKKQLKRHFGGLLTIELENQEECFRFLNKLKLIHIATNLNDNITLAIHPFSTIYCEFPSEEILSLDINDKMIRLSIGIEDIEDLKQDIQQALEF